MGLNVKQNFLKLKLIYTKTFLCIYFDTKIDGDQISEYSIRVSGECGESCIAFESRLWSTSGRLYFQVDNPNLWWPKNVGVPNIYEAKFELLQNGKVLDEVTQNVDIRIIELDRIDEVKEGGRFNFVVNGKKVFVTGTNWVPLDAIHANDVKRMNKALNELDDIGCNIG